MRRSQQTTRIIIAILSVLILVSMVLTGVATMAGASPAGSRADTRLDTRSAPGTAVNLTTEPGDTTTTQPTDYRVFGKSITKPNQGMEPQEAGDPGGWLQSSLFFLVCGAIILMALAVSYKSHRVRAARKAAGLDPADIARRRGEGVRAPSPLDAKS